jgi:hypothetical protein
MFKVTFWSMITLVPPLGILVSFIGIFIGIGVFIGLLIAIGIFMGMSIGMLMGIDNFWGIVMLSWTVMLSCIAMLTGIVVFSFSARAMSNEDNKRTNEIMIPMSIEFFNFSPPCLMIDYSRIRYLFGQMTFGRKIGGNGTKREHNYGA